MRPRAASTALRACSPWAMVWVTFSWRSSMCFWSCAAAASRSAMASLRSERDTDHAGGVLDRLQRVDQRLGELLHLFEQRLEDHLRELRALLRVLDLLLEVVERGEDLVHLRLHQLLDLLLHLRLHL